MDLDLGQASMQTSQWSQFHHPPGTEAGHYHAPGGIRILTPNSSKSAIVYPVQVCASLLDTPPHHPRPTLTHHQTHQQQNIHLLQTLSHLSDLKVNLLSSLKEQGVSARPASSSVLW